MTITERDRGASGASLRALVERHRDDIKAAAARHRSRRVRLFGSVARGEEREDSDIDLLVDFVPEAPCSTSCTSTESSRSFCGVRSMSSRAVGSRRATEPSSTRQSSCDSRRRRTDPRHHRSRFRDRRNCRRGQGGVGDRSRAAACVGCHRPTDRAGAPLPPGGLRPGMDHRDR
jgi:hypothetical protein